MAFRMRAFSFRWWPVYHQPTDTFLWLWWAWLLSEKRRDPYLGRTGSGIIPVIREEKKPLGRKRLVIADLKPVEGLAQTQRARGVNETARAS